MKTATTVRLTPKVMRDADGARRRDDEPRERELPQQRRALDDREHAEARRLAEESVEHDADQQRERVVLEIEPSLKIRPKTRYSIVKSASGFATDQT